MEPHHPNRNRLLAAVFFACLFGLGPSGQAQTLAEALDTTNLVWTTGGNSVWFVQTTNTHDGVDAVRYGNISTNETSWLETTVIGPATVRFWTLRSWGSGPLAFVSLSINGNIGVSPGMPRPPGLPGTAWAESVLDLGGGSNVLRWTAYKPYGATSSSFGALDQMVVSPPRPLDIEYHPQATEVASGEWAYLWASAIGTPPIRYQWRREGVNLPDATNAWLSIGPLTTNDTGYYSVVVSNSQGFLISSNALVTVLPPTAPFISSQPWDQTVYAGGTATFGGSVSGTPPISFQWRKDGLNIPDATNASFILATAATNDAGLYSVVASNAQGFAVSSNALLTVLPPSPPVITYDPQGKTAYLGLTAELYAAVDGSPPFFFQWRKDGTNLPTATSTSQWGSASLTLENVSNADAGNYRLFVTNSYGSAESAVAAVTVTPTVAPVILRQPRSLEVAEGVNTWLSVEALGAPPPCHIWSRWDVPPPPYAICQLPERFFNNVTTNDAGIYFAKLSNVAGTDISRDALLTVLPPIVHAGSWSSGAVDIFVTNKLAYLARGTNGLAILSVSNPALPQLLGTFNTTGYLHRVVVAEGKAYLPRSSAGFQIVSVTNPFNPVLVGSYNGPGYASDLAVRSNRAYVVDHNTGLLIVDVSNPTAPVTLGNFRTNFSAYRVCLSGDYAVVSAPFLPILTTNMVQTNVAGLFVINVSDPAHPFEAGRGGPFGITSMEARGQTILGVGYNHLTAISITNPAQPIAVGSFSYYVSTNLPPRSPPPPAGIFANDVSVENDLAYVVGYSEDESRLYVLNVRDPSDPIPVGYYASTGQAYTIGAAGNTVLFAGGETPLRILQTPFNTAPVMPPKLAVSLAAGPKMHLQGRRGLHYDIESAGSLANLQWQRLQTVLLTNDVMSVPLPGGTSPRFFRLKQLD